MNPLIDVVNQRVPMRRPVWIMRQAGRYLPEYREVRAKAGSFLGLCYDPEAATEVTLQPLRRFDLDAAIVFADILVVPHAMGLSLDFQEGEGPILGTVKSSGDVAKLLEVSKSWQVARVCETVTKVKRGLSEGKCLIGFCGGPWTVASYMIEGRSSNRTKALALSVAKPLWFLELIERLVEASISYLCRQIEAGADVVQIFDSWAGDIGPENRDVFVLQPIHRIVVGVRNRFPRFPVIVFARGVGGYHGEVAAGTDASAIGVEDGISLLDVLAKVPKSVALQGNLSPQILLGSKDDIKSAVRAILRDVPASHHIFNLGHGILPETDPANLEFLIQCVRDFDGAG